MPALTKLNTALIALLLSALLVAPSALAGYPEWQKPKQCVFGMPYIGHAVKPGTTGLITEVLKAVFEPEGYDLLHRNLPYNHVLSELDTGSVHCSIGLKDYPKVEVRGTAVIAFWDMAVACAADDEFKGVESLAGQKVAFMYGYELENLLPVKVLPRAAYDLSSAFNMIDRGHVRYVIDDDSLLRDAIVEAKLQPNEFRITKIGSLEVRPIFAPTKEGRMFREIYDRRMKVLLDSSRLRKILLENGMAGSEVERILKANRQ